MKKIISLGLFFIVAFFFQLPLKALDPYARKSMGNFGMIQVQTPNPSKDEILLTATRTGRVETIPSGKVQVVHAGNYKLRVLMEGEEYNGNVVIRPTERTDITVGFGSLKVKGSRSAIVQVFDKKQGKLMAEFPASKTQLLPRGTYEVKVRVNGMETAKSE